MSIGFGGKWTLITGLRGGGGGGGGGGVEGNGGGSGGGGWGGGGGCIGLDICLYI